MTLPHRDEVTHGDMVDGFEARKIGDEVAWVYVGPQTDLYKTFDFDDTVDTIWQTLHEFDAGAPEQDWFVGEIIIATMQYPSGWNAMGRWIWTFGVDDPVGTDPAFASPNDPTSLREWEVRWTSSGGTQKIEWHFKEPQEAGHTIKVVLIARKMTDMQFVA